MCSESAHADKGRTQARGQTYEDISEGNQLRLLPNMANIIRQFQLKITEELEKGGAPDGAGYTD